MQTLTRWVAEMVQYKRDKKVTKIRIPVSMHFKGTQLSREQYSYFFAGSSHVSRLGVFMTGEGLDDDGYQAQVAIGKMGEDPEVIYPIMVFPGENNYEKVFNVKTKNVMSILMDAPEGSSFGVYFIVTQEA